MNKLSRQHIENELIAITIQLLADSGELHQRDIKMDMSLQRHLGIDSLSRAELFRRIEKIFAVSVPDRLLAEAETLNDIALFLETASPGIKRPTTQKIITSHGARSTVDPAQAKSLTELLLFYAEQSPDKAHIYFQHEDNKEETITYGHLLQSSLRVARGLREYGLQEGETVAIMQPSHPGFFYTFFGTLLAGGIPVPIYPPFRMHMLEAYAKTEAKILSNAEVRILVTFEQAETLSRLLKTFVPSLKHVVTVQDLMHQAGLTDIFSAKLHNFAFIQYTSGSTADPKGVLLTHQNLLSNIHAYGKAINVTPEDVAVSWLPLYHDMGLIGMWLGSLYYGIPLILLTPFSFLNHPERWLWAIHYHRGTCSGAPNFAYELCVRKIDQALLEGLDLSCWRMAANGAEKVYPRTLELFAEKFAPYGFKRNALLPVYGLAESTVALAIPPLDREFLVDQVDRKKFEEQRLALPATGKNTLPFVSCGPAIEHHSIRIVDDDQNVLPEREVGNLQFRGPSMMQGYFNNPVATAKIYHDGWMDTGDLAYIANKELYITGRRKDLIIKAGRNLYPAEIEEMVGAIAGVRQGCVAAFGITDNERGTEQLVIVAETRAKNKAKREALQKTILEVISTNLDIVPDAVVLVAPHVVPKTSSGKLQRAACKRMYLEGGLGKFRVPAWLQIVKLAVKSVGRVMISLLGKTAKCIFTAYLLSVMLISLLPVYLLVRFTSRQYAASVTRGWARFVMLVSLSRVKKTGMEKLTAAAPVIFVANHASYIDAIIVMSFMPANTFFIGKKELLTTPVIGTFMRKLDYLPVDRLDLTKGLEDTLHIEQTLKQGRSVFIFPEGTFSYASGLRPFRLGAFKAAVETQTPICPIAIAGTRYILRDDEKLMRPGKIEITVCDLVKPGGSEWHDVTTMRTVVRAEIAKYCGEPTLDYIAAQSVAPKIRP